MSGQETPRRRAVRPRDAATVVLVRAIKNQLCVLMGQRHGKHKFMPDQYVFPGGRVDRADGFVEAASELRPHVAQRLSVAASPHRARALAMAAVRETFEETGLIIGRPTKERPARASDGWKPFFEAGFLPELSGLEYIHRAVTPPFRPIRFNARFFLASGEGLHGTLEGSGELLNLDWIPLPEAQKLPMPGIQEIVLQELQNHVDEDFAIRTPKQVPVRRMLHGKRAAEFE